MCFLRHLLDQSSLNQGLGLDHYAEEIFYIGVENVEETPECSNTQFPADNFFLNSN